MTSYNGIVLEYARFRNAAKKYWKITQRVILMMIVMFLVFVYYYKIPKVDEILKKSAGVSNDYNKPYEKANLITFQAATTSASSSSSFLMASGVLIGKFSNQKTYTLKEIDAKFLQMNSGNNISNSVYKPFVIYKHLMENTRMGDVLVYADTNTYDRFTTSVHTFLHSILLSNQEDDIYFFRSVVASSDSNNNIVLAADTEQVKFAKYLLNFNTPETTPPLTSRVSFIVIRKSFKAIKFVSEWLTYVQDKRVNDYLEEDVILNLLIRKKNLKIKPLANRDFISYK